MHVLAQDLAFEGYLRGCKLCRVLVSDAYAECSNVVVVEFYFSGILLYLEMF